MKTFYLLLANGMIVITKNNYVWFALTYWIYLQTESVVATSAMGGFFLVTTALSSIWFGSLVDHRKKKSVMIGSNLVTMLLFAAASFLYYYTPETVLADVTSLQLWGLVALLLSGVVVGNIYGIVIPTLVTILVPEKKRDKANGMVGTAMGISFAITSVASGISLAYIGMGGVLVIALSLTVIALLQLLFVSFKEKTVSHHERKQQKIDLIGTIRVVKEIPGMFALIFFTTFNNFLGGVFMALMDAYGLSLVSVQTWGFLWGVLSSGFILGGAIIATRGLGKSPLKTLFRINIIVWIVCIFFTIQPSIILLAIGMFIWITLMPFVEATEQTIIQKVVPLERQGRVFGFAHSVEQAASPLTAFVIGPIAQFIFIPFMTTGEGVELIGDWYGTGAGRGLALVFTITGVIGLCVTLFAMRSPAYARLQKRYNSDKN